MSDKQKNVLGEDLEECSNDPLTGWHRDGCCSTDENDHGVHTVCAKVTTEFLEWCNLCTNSMNAVIIFISAATTITMPSC